MTLDPAQRLADIGRRVLETVEPLITFSGSGWLPNTYESLLLDPMAALANTCSELLEQSHAVPVAAEHGGSPSKPGNLVVSGPNVRAPSPSSRAVAPVARISQDVYNSYAGWQREIPAAMRPSSAASGPGGLPSLEQVRQAMEASLLPFLEEPGSPITSPGLSATTLPDGSVSQAGAPARSFDEPQQPAERGPDLQFGPRDRPSRYVEEEQPAKLGSDLQSVIRDRPSHYVEAEQPARHEPRPHGARPPPVVEPPAKVPLGPEGLEGEPSSEGRDGTWRLGRQERLEDGWPEPSSGAIMRAGADPAWGVRKANALSLSQPGEVRLAASTERLTTVLQTHLAATEDLFGTRDGVAAFPAHPEDGDGRSIEAVDEPDRVRQDNRVRVEEIMERLADELETEFVRTYGSSGS